MRKSICITLACVLVALIANASSMNAQGTTATIIGLVKDSSGAVIPGVTVDVKNVGTGPTQTAVTDEQGRYTVPELQIGEYEVTAGLPGFQTVARRGIALTVGSRVIV